MGYWPIKEGYACLAALAHSEKKKLFRLRPKFHSLMEIGVALESSAATLSPLATCCWTDEDYIGKVSRTARSCHGACVSIGAMRKSLGNYCVQLTKAQARS